MPPLTPRQPYPQDHASHIPILVGIGKKFQIRRVLELGSGNYSTNLFLNRNVFPDLVELVSIERDLEWSRRVQDLNDTRVILNPDHLLEPSRFDLIFIDSSHTSHRIAALKEYAAKPDITGLIVIHDSENPYYRNPFSLFPNWFDIDAYEPSTAVLWHNHASPEAIRNTLQEISEIVVKFVSHPPDDVSAWIGYFRNPFPKHLSVTVAMCSYRRHEQLRNTFDTFMQQTRMPEQIIVVEDGYDGGLTETVCREYAGRLPVEWICRRNRPNLSFSNAAIPRNIGIKRSTGDIVVIQNPEVRFTKPTDLANIVGPTEENPMVSTCAPCEALNWDGGFKAWYCNPDIAGNINHFCQAFRRDQLIALGGFDEEFRGYGYEDADFCYRFNRTGVRSIFAKDVIVQHQMHWYPENDPDNMANEKFNIAYGEQVVRDIMSGKRTIEANRGKNWGDINS